MRLKQGAVERLLEESPVKCVTWANREMDQTPQDCPNDLAQVVHGIETSRRGRVGPVARTSPPSARQLRPGTGQSGAQ